MTTSCANNSQVKSCQDAFGEKSLNQSKTNQHLLFWSGKPLCDRNVSWPVIPGCCSYHHHKSYLIVYTSSPQLRWSALWKWGRLLQFCIVAHGKTIALVSTAVTKVANLTKPIYIKIFWCPTLKTDLCHHGVCVTSTNITTTFNIIKSAFLLKISPESP